METININTEFIKLGQFLKFIGAVFLGGEVKFFLQNNIVKVNDKVEMQRGKKLFSGDIIEVNNKKFIIKVKNAS